MQQQVLSRHISLFPVLCSENRWCFIDQVTVSRPLSASSVPRGPQSGWASLMPLSPTLGPPPHLTQDPGPVLCWGVGLGYLTLRVRAESRHKVQLCETASSLFPGEPVHLLVLQVLLCRREAGAQSLDRVAQCHRAELGLMCKPSVVPQGFLLSLPRNKEQVGLSLS